MCHFPEGVRKLYPEDEILREFQVEAFIGHPLTDASGRVLGLLAVMHAKPLANPGQIQSVLQISAARAAAELERIAADADRHKLASAVEQTADSVLITDVEGVIQYVNPGYEKTTGYTRAEAVGKKPNIVKSGKHGEGFYRTLWETIRAGNVFRDVLVNRRKNGELYYEEKTITPLKDDKGHITHFVSTGKDVSEHMRAERTLRESERRYAELIEQAPDAIVTLDLNGHMQTLNPAAERLCGFPADELIGMHFAEAGILAPESLARAIEEFPLVVAGEERPPFDLTVLRKNGDRVFTEINPRLIRHSDQPAVVQVTLRDITERKRAEGALRANEARLAEAQRLARLGNWELDLVGNTLTWSDEIYRIFEIDPAKFGASYEAFLDAIYPDDREPVNRAYTEIGQEPDALRHRTPPAHEGRARQARPRTVRDLHQRRRETAALSRHGAGHHRAAPSRGTVELPCLPRHAHAPAEPRAAARTPAAGDG